MSRESCMHTTWESACSSSCCEQLVGCSYIECSGSLCIACFCCRCWQGSMRARSLVQLAHLHDDPEGGALGLAARHGAGEAWLCQHRPPGTQLAAAALAGARLCLTKGANQGSGLSCSAGHAAWLSRPRVLQGTLGLREGLGSSRVRAERMRAR